MPYTALDRFRSPFHLDMRIIMPIDADRILRESFVKRMEHHGSLASTNDRAVECARAGSDHLPLLIVADQQTAGRGRGANRWWTGHGSLAMSLLVDAALVGADRQRSPLVALAVALTVVDTVQPLLPSHRVGIHWPNDVMVCDGVAADRKVAGILVEVLPDRRHIVGIGLNTNNTLADAPPELRETACTIGDLTAKQLDHTVVLVALLECLERDFAQLRAGATGVAERVNALCLQRGRLLTVDSGGNKTAGRCQGIAGDGALVLDMPAGLQRFVSGVVRFA